ncbi:MAG: alpha/beta hydrolase family protein [Phycisphaerae bacterium]
MAPSPQSKRKSTPLALSPSRVHLSVLKQTPQKLHYDGGELGPWRRKLRRKLRELIRPPVYDGALKVRTLWKRDHPLGTIEKIAFRAEPHADVVAYWCVPADAQPPYLTFICLQGHSTGMHNSIAVLQEDETKPKKVAGDRDFAIGCMKRGIAALCIEQRSFGERGEKDLAMVSEYNTCHDAAVHALMLGRTLLGERILDVDRGIDYLAQRGDVDMKRLGCMGNSGGGTTTMYAAALLDRIQAIIPSCCVAKYADSIMSIYHCGCNCVPGIVQYADMDDVIGLFAPKPCVIVSGKDDEIFPVRSARRSAADLKRIYKTFGGEQNFRHVIGPEGHRFYADLAWDAMLPMLEKQ